MGDKNYNKGAKMLPLLMIVGIILVLIIFSNSRSRTVEIGRENQTEERFLDIEGYFDANGNPIQTIKPLAVVNGVEGVKFITIGINIRNIDVTPLTFFVINMTPASVRSAIPTAKIKVLPGLKGKLVTGFIDVERFVGKMQDFCFTVESEEVPNLREAVTKTACLGVKIEPDPIAQFNVQPDEPAIDDNANVTASCQESWSCTSFGTCIIGVQYRTCIDVNKCSTIQSKPNEVASCIGPEFQTNAIDGDYSEKEVYIIVNGISYGFDALSSYTCLVDNTIMKTPENFTICSRPSFNIKSRVYLQDDATNTYLFKSF